MTAPRKILKALLAPAIALLATSWSVPADAGEAVRGVVELFTSQGCSSCPPADAAFMEIAEKNGIVAVSYHVDYWNYRGWKDTLSAPEFSQRQYGYAASLGHANVFTPQAVLNGRSDVVASDASAIESKIDTLTSTGQGMSVPVTTRLTGDELTIDIGAGTGKADIVVAYIKDRAKVVIDRGENAGSTIDYAHAVVDLAIVGMWEGKAMTIRLPTSEVIKNGRDGCAIFVQSKDKNNNPSAILGAAIIGDYPKN